MSKKHKTSSNFNLDDIISKLPDEGAKKPGISFGGQATTPGELSSSYVEVKKSDVTSLPKETYVRYADASGVLKPGGGKIKSIEHTPDGDVMVKIGKYNVSTKKYFMWSFKLSEVSKVYRFVPPATSTTKQNAGVSSSSSNNSFTPGAYNSNSSMPSVSPGQPIPPSTEEDRIINQLGDKMLFDDAEMLTQRLNMVEASVQKLEEDLKKIFILVKRIYRGMGATV